jgi:predicted cupin superfamily sugar epimerase
MIPSQPLQPTNLAAHPEGGRFKEAYRSSAEIEATDGRKRVALTHIYFQLEAGEVSKFHKVDSDEVWNLYQGEGIRLHIWDGSENMPETVTLSAATNTFCHVIPAGFWQAAEPLGNSVLVGCSVAPGFEFEDFEIINPDSVSARCLLSMVGHWNMFV